MCRCSSAVLRFVLLAHADLGLAVVVERQRDEVRAAAHRAVLGEGLTPAAAHVDEELVLLPAERAPIGHARLRAVRTGTAACGGFGNRTARDRSSSRRRRRTARCGARSARSPRGSAGAT